MDGRGDDGRKDVETNIEAKREVVWEEACYFDLSSCSAASAHR
jgi:hypothetical protein